MTTDARNKMIAEAETAIENARQVRLRHARRSPKSSKQRRDDINIAIKRLRSAMNPIRSEIGSFPHRPQTEIAETNEQRDQIRALSIAIQRERRKLWKMRGRKK